MSIRRRLLIRGRVQGVFFRDSVRERARAEGVGGWAENLSDGALEVVLEGDRESVGRVERFCQTGPEDARVDDIEAQDKQPEGLGGFEIR